MSQNIQQWCARGLALLIALVVSSESQARSIKDTPSALYYTADEERGIQLPEADASYLGTCFYGCNEFLPNGNRNPIYRPNDWYQHAVVEPWVHNLDRHDFSQNSTDAFDAIGGELSRQAARSRFNPFRAAWVYDTDEETFVIADRSLGPLLAERATTLGAGRFAIGFSYRQVNWDRLNGEKLGSMFRRINHQDKDGDGFLTGQETDYIDVYLRMKIEQDFVDFFVEYGITNSIDLGVVLPVVNTNMELDGEAYIHWGGDDPARTGDLNGWTQAQSDKEHFFCRLQRTKVPIQMSRFLLSVPYAWDWADVPDNDSQNIIGGEKLCPNKRGDSSSGRGRRGFYGPAMDHKTERAIGIGDVRVRLKWHALESDFIVPDIALLTEWKPPTGRVDDYQGTGDHSFSTYLVGGWHIWRVHPHFNVGVEVGPGPQWKNATEWIIGSDFEITEWLGASVDYLGRKPFGSRVADRHEIGGGLKLVPVPGFALSFDAIFPLNKNEGLTSNMIWRIGGQFQF